MTPRLPRNRSNALTLAGEAGTVRVYGGLKMILIRTLVCLAALSLLSAPGARAAQGGFSGGTFSCLEFTNGLGDKAAGRIQSSIARLWVQGYLTGFFKGKGTLAFTEDPAEMLLVDELFVQKCKEVPAAPILTVALQVLAAQSLKLPQIAAGDFKPGTYTCGQHLDAKNGPASKANAADLAEMWAFAFIQGFKNVTQPDVEIKPEFRDALVGALNKACGGSNREKLFLDQSAQVAERVKIAP